MSDRKKKGDKKKSVGKKPLKKAFDLGRDSIYVADPIADLRICGARGVVPADEAGDLDTAPGPDVSVKDQRRLSHPLKEGLKENVYRRSVTTPIVIAKIDDVATVVEGKSRVRAARAANRRRAADGLPLMRVRCVIQRDTSALAIAATVISGNNAREDDDLTDKIEKLKSYLALGASEADAAVAFTVSPKTIRGWLDYDDHATDETKRAARDGQLTASTAAELARIKDPDTQRAALAKMVTAPGVKDRSARAARALRRGTEGVASATDRKSQKLLLSHVDVMLRDGRARRTSREEEFWRGVRETLRLVTAQEVTREELLTALAEARGAGAPVEPTAVEAAGAPR